MALFAVNISVAYCLLFGKLDDELTVRLGRTSSLSVDADLERGMICVCNRFCILTAEQAIRDSHSPTKLFDACVMRILSADILLH